MEGPFRWEGEKHVARPRVCSFSLFYLSSFPIVLLFPDTSVTC